MFKKWPVRWLPIPVLLAVLIYFGVVPTEWARVWLSSIPTTPSAPSTLSSPSTKDSNQVANSSPAQGSSNSAESRERPPGGAGQSFAQTEPPTFLPAGNAGPVTVQTRTGGLPPSGIGPPPDQRSLIVGTFNIQVFGQAKFSSPDVMQILVDMVRRFDLIAIQELRSTEQDIIPRFVAMLNATGLEFDFWVGPRQGYTISKEQYVYIYDRRKLRLMDEPYVADDQVMHRAPLVARFQSIELPPEQAVTFCLLNVHTDPDEVESELKALQQVVARVRASLPEEDDFLILGDFNAPTDIIDSHRLLQDPMYVVQDSWVTNTRETRNYDNIVFNRYATREYMGRAGVFNFRREYQLSLEDALQVSDHFPVWALFSIYEQSDNTMAHQPSNAR